ncbi:MAG: TldD/PmbA family protein [Synergistes sp.]|nr:TldD/PmbA family protein [Synergistes sp.]
MTEFLSHNEIEALAEHALTLARKNGACGADIQYSEGKSNTLSLRDGEIEESKCGTFSGIGVRTILSDGRQGIAYGSSLDRMSVDSLVEWSLHNAKISQPDEGVVLYDGPLVHVPELEEEDMKIRVITHEDRLKYCTEMTKEAKGTDNRIISVRDASWHDGWGASYFATSKGLSAWESGSGADASVTLLAQQDEFTEMGAYGTSSMRMDEIQRIEIARKAARDTLSALGGKQIKTGSYTVMIERETASSLVDIIGSLFCASDVMLGHSMMKGKLGELVASPCVNITDDGTIPWKSGSSSWDSEGVPTSRTELIKDGVASAYLYNLQYAAKAGTKSTGNCARGLSSLPAISTANIILEQGKDTPEALMKAMGHGVYITEFMGLHTIDPVSGNFSLGAKGRAITNGELGAPVSGITIAGNLLDFMKKITAVASDLIFSGASASPSVVVEGVLIAGN